MKPLVLAAFQRLVPVALVLLLGVGSTACGMLALGGPSTVAQGRYYASGNRQFDEFFLNLYQHQVKFAEAPEELAKARAELAKAAAVDESTPDAELAEKLHAALEKLIPRGIRVKIEVEAPSPPDPAATAASVKNSGDPTEGERASLRTIETALTALVKLRATMQAATPRLGELRLLATQLDTQIDTAFDLGGSGKRREVRSNLSDGVKVIALMFDRAKAIEAQSGGLATLVVEKAGTDDGTVGMGPPTPADVPTPSAPAPAAPAAAPPPPAAAPAPPAAAPPPPPPKAEPKPAPRPIAPAPAPPRAEAKPKPKDTPKPAEFEP